MLIAVLVFPAPRELVPRLMAVRGRALAKQIALGESAPPLLPNVPMINVARVAESVLPVKPKPVLPQIAVPVLKLVRQISHGVFVKPL